MKRTSCSIKYPHCCEAVNGCTAVTMGLQPQKLLAWKGWIGCSVRLVVFSLWIPPTRSRCIKHWSFSCYALLCRNSLANFLYWPSRVSPSQLNQDCTNALSSAFCLGWGFPLSAGVRTSIHPAGLNVWCQFSNAPLSKEISHLTFKFMHIYLNTAVSYCFLFFYFYPKSSISVLFPKGRNCTETAVSPGLWVGFSISIIIILLADKFCG